MSLHGLTKGTNLEQQVKTMAQAEANGVMMYYALARLAKEQGFDDVAEKFIEAANQEAIHAGFYATLNGKYPQNFWNLVRGLQKAEMAGESQVNAFAQKIREFGSNEAADEMEIFAKQEGHHGVMLQEILDKYQPELPDLSGKVVYTCPLCGYQYIGDINSENDDYVCPICSMPKKSFKKAE